MKVKDLKKLLENVDGEVPVRLIQKMFDENGELVAKVELPLLAILSKRLGTTVEIFFTEDDDIEPPPVFNEAGLP